MESLFAELAQEVEANTGTHMSPEAVAEGFLKIAIENMAKAVKNISVQVGCWGGVRLHRSLLLLLFP